MRPDDLKKQIKKLKLKTSNNLDQRIHSQITNILAQPKTTPANKQLGLWSTVSKSKIAQIAVAAVIIIATCLFFMQQEQTGEIKTQQITRTAKLPAELTTFASFSFAYRQGGMEMVEQMCDKALKMAGQRPANISLQDFFEEINNGKSERTEL
jgi:hypothetical protein